MPHPPNTKFVHFGTSYEVLYPERLAPFCGEDDVYIGRTLQTPKTDWKVLGFLEDWCPACLRMCDTPSSPGYRPNFDAYRRMPPPQHTCTTDPSILETCV